jgi:uncharacterized lipoprotein YddW (UPF0748 family)
MRKIKIVCLCAALVLFLGACQVDMTPPAPEKNTPRNTAYALPEETKDLPEIRAVWLSYLELTQKSGVRKAAFTQRYKALFAQMQDVGVKTVFVQVRPFSDALYESDLLPWSAVLGGVQGVDPGYDPLKILIALGKSYGLAIHAWINPFRIGENGKKMAAGNPALAHVNAKDSWVAQSGGTWYWNPGSKDVHAMLFTQMRELLENYDLSGLHIDDYFYPTTQPDFDAALYAQFKKSGTLTLEEWRRENVNTFVRGLYKTVKEVNPELIFSVSPSGNLEKNKDEMYADCALWAAEAGYCDWLLPQLYFGFDHETMPFAQVAAAWGKLKKHDGLKLAAGLPAYKAGQGDTFAGNGRYEWQLCGDVLARQLTEILLNKNYGGFALYSCGSFFADSLSATAQKEKENFFDALAHGESV